MADDYVPAADGQRFALDSLQSLADFAHACDRLRAGRSYGALAKAARPRPLPAATLSDMINAKTTPTRETVITFLTACGLGAAAQRQWLAAWERIATAHRPQPHGAVRVGQARPRLLGVHASIQTPGAVGDMPPYVPRDFDVRVLDFARARQPPRRRGGRVPATCRKLVGRQNSGFVRGGPHRTAGVVAAAPG